ncbi:hypothetical protein IAQ61_003759 [Plenodomus lingam]|uniref:Heterokaryon incompatibility domain-containing protein n=1 Tax=Leptosphaeria maculans (strain JN3 / isolate v23.1.3 / race Av1-4-5-6-7-8) TaxID=985895 RepID=E4ZRN2_LEPMJ|nr:hypothetical protein LEMA_P035530.1 [Plenodomus lingam JN3]KAH9874570.1 hypothetical protein IAQ61_003759 [Plenodomus lingam]CBX93879.1 hypothetical protein LEMA_P035530.1 [Plenodomus lingam JN3]
MSQRSPCSFCREKILRARDSWDYHHSSYFSLRTSARRQCVFCRILFEDVQHHQINLEKFASADTSIEQAVRRWLQQDTKNTKKLALLHPFPISLYRWSTRSLGRTREGKATIAITFRVVPGSLDTSGENQSQEGAETFGLPERTFYCFPETDLNPLLIPIDLGMSTYPRVNGGHQIKRWIRDCGIYHKNCPKRAGAGSKWVPTRLLHVGGRREGESIRVVDTKVANVKGPYVTLSHCWGPSPEKRRDILTAQSWKEFTEVGVPWNFLSKNFQQAIEVARFLEVDYIWIDSLCIIQGDTAEWKREGALMHKVYRNSYCNIAAADAANSQEGLFRQREPQDVIPARFEADGASPMFGKNKWQIIRGDLWEHDLLSRPLYTRGWVFQERMLAPRVLHFCQHQIFWDCTEMSACESLPGGLPLPLDRSSSIDRHWRGRLQEGISNQALILSATNDDSPEDFWKAAIEAYTSLDLTNQDDKRMAVWGIAKLVRDSLDEEYAVGMWGLFLEEQLAWKVADYATSERPEVLKMNPSWSWVSVKGRIIVQDRSGRRNRVYRVRNHNGQALSFKISQEMIRPKAPRQTSGDRQKDIANMSKDLELVDDRRRKSSVTSRHNSEVGLSTSISQRNSLVSTARKDSNKDRLLEHENAKFRPMIRKTWSWKPVNYTIGTPQAPESPSFFPFSALFTIILALAYGFMSWFWCLSSHAMSTLRLLISRERCRTLTAETDSIENAPNSRDVEPELSDKKIAVQGYIHRGDLQWSNEIGEYLLFPRNAAKQQLRETIIEAYPDTTEDARAGAVTFVILALSQKFEHNSINLIHNPELELKTWYEGHGIMIRSSGVDQQYFRTGAVQIHKLSAEMWHHIQQICWEQVEPPTDLEEWEGEKFWIA